MQSGAQIVVKHVHIVYLQCIYSFPCSPYMCVPPSGTQMQHECGHVMSVGNISGGWGVLLGARAHQRGLRRVGGGWERWVGGLILLRTVISTCFSHSQTCLLAPPKKGASPPTVFPLPAGQKGSPRPTSRPLFPPKTSRKLVQMKLPRPPSTGGGPAPAATKATATGKTGDTSAPRRST